MNDLISGVIQIGSINTICCLGLFLTFRVLKVTDLGIEGSFLLGQSVCGILINAGLTELIATVSTSVIGACIGAISFLLHQIFKVYPILSGLLLSAALYSVSARLLGVPNLVLDDEVKVFSLSISSDITLGTLAILATLGIFLLLKTHLGLVTKAYGINQRLSQSFGLANGIPIIMFMISHFLVAFAGALFSQLQGFVDISIQSSILMPLLASLFLGEFLTQKLFKSLNSLSLIIGAMTYQIIISFALNMTGYWTRPTDLPFFTSVILFVLFIFSNQKKMIFLGKVNKHDSA